MSLITSQQMRRREKKKAKLQHVTDPVLFCLNVLHRQKKEEQEALEMVARLFSTDDVVKAKDKIFSLLGTESEAVAPEDEIDVTASGGSEPAGKDQLNIALLRDVAWAMHEIKRLRKEKFKYVVYTACTTDIHRYVTMA